MASEGAADPGAQPPAPPAPSEGKKSRKKRKEKPEAGNNAQEGGDEMEGLIRAGGRALGDTREAGGCFRGALLLPGGTATPQLPRACAFSLGAAYVGTEKPEKGLEFLLRSQLSEGDGGERRGDLYFKAGAAQEGLRDFPKALEYLGGGGDGGAGGHAGTRVRMGSCHLGMREPGRAARCFLEAARGYAAAASPEEAAVALSRASTSMLQSRRFGAAEIAGVLAQCRSLCPSIPDPVLRGKLYNDIGLGYSQLRIFSLATESFQRALDLCGQERDRCGEAVALQNLGAAHNALRSFGTALGWHRRAAALHGSLGNRRAQGQCFGNLAYACSRLGNHQAAAENYLHALQAFRDTGDVQGQWQACEGLGSACFYLGDPQKAIGHYKEALMLLSCCQDTPRAARERVVHKLTEAIQHQLCPHGGARLPAPDPGRLRFHSTLPHASGTRLRESEASLGGKAQPGDKLDAPAPDPRPGHSDSGAAPADGPTPEPRDPRGHLDISGEDEDGPSAAPGSRSQPRANGNLNATHPVPVPPRHRPRDRGHQPPRRRPLERHPTPRNALVALLSSSPTANPTAKPRTRSRMLSLVCSLV